MFHRPISRSKHSFSSINNARTVLILAPSSSSKCGRTTNHFNAASSQHLSFVDGRPLPLPSLNHSPLNDPPPPCFGSLATANFFHEMVQNPCETISLWTAGTYSVCPRLLFTCLGLASTVIFVVILISVGPTGVSRHDDSTPLCHYSAIQTTEYGWVDDAQFAYEQEQTGGI